MDTGVILGEIRGKIRGQEIPQEIQDIRGNPGTGLRSYDLG